MKKILVAALMWPLLALAQSYPSPHFNNLTVDGTLNAGTIGLTNPLPIGSGGTGSATAVGATSNLQYNGGGTGAISRSLTSKLGDISSSMDVGADPTGINDSSTAFSNLFSRTSGYFYTPSGTYKLGSNFIPTVRDVTYVSDPSVQYTGTGKFQFDNILPYQTAPIFASNVYRKTYTTAYDNYQNIFLMAAHAVNSTTSAPVVAVYGTGEAASSGGRAFGANFTGFVTANGGRATGVEIDAGYRNGATTGHAYGLTMSAGGAVAPDAAIQVQSNNSTSQWGNGLNFSFNSSPGTGAVTGALIRAGSNGGSATVGNFLLATSDMSASSAEVDFPSFRVEATPPSVTNRVSIKGAATGVAPQLKAVGTDTNVPLNLVSQGNGVIQFTTNGVENFRVQAAAGVDNLQVGAGTGAASLSARGSSTDVNVVVAPKGAGTIQLNGPTSVSNGLTVTGTVSGTGFDNYITSANTRGLIDSMTNAKAYGALGNSNGTHGNGNDDTTALQNALNASANGVLHIPCGTYRITASISENSPTSNYWIMGDGECTKIYNDGATAFATFVFNPASANNNVNPTVKVSGIYFINPNVTGAGQAAVSFTNEERPYFQNNIVYGYQQGVVYVSTFAPVIDHNTFHQLKGSAIDCSTDSSCNSGTIWQNGFFSGGIANSAPAINLNAPASGINGISIIGNDIEANNTGILFQNVSGAIVHGNYIENQTSGNLFFNSGNASIDFNGNWLGASPTLTLSNNLANSIFENNAIYNYTIAQGTSTSVRQINNTTTGTGSITVPSIGQLNSNTTTGTSMTSNTAVNCTSITLPAGTWDVSGSIQFVPAASTVISYMSASISPTSGTVGAQPNRTDIGGISATGSNVGSMSESTPVVRETFASSTPVYLVGNSVFTTSTMTCNGYIRAVLVQ